MRYALRSILFLSFALLASKSHADTIDDFTLTGAGHTITYSLPATSSYPDYSLFGVVTETATATIDGVPGYSTYGQYVVFPFFPFTFELSVPTAVFQTSTLEFSGASILTYISVPANNLPPYLPYDIVTTFTPGTYNLQATTGDPFNPGPIPYTLTITPEAATTPEPSTLILLATGTLALFSRRKLLFKAQPAP